MDKARETKKKRRRGLARVYHPRHGDTSLMVVMAPFRDELSHGQWFRETPPPPPPSFTKTGRVKSSLRLAQDREHSEIVVARSLSLSRYQLQEWILKYATDYHSRIPVPPSSKIPWLSFPPACRPLPWRAQGPAAYTRTLVVAFLSTFSTIFPPLHLVRLVS